MVEEDNNSTVTVVADNVTAFHTPPAPPVMHFPIWASMAKTFEDCTSLRFVFAQGSHPIVDRYFFNIERGGITHPATHLASFNKLVFTQELGNNGVLGPENIQRNL